VPERGRIFGVGFYLTNLRYRRAAANDRDLETMLTNAGVDGDDIRIEEFSGY